MLGDGKPIRHLLMVMLALAALVPARAGAASGPAARLVAPGDGAVLAAGSLAAIEWEPGDGFGELRAEEWEAFLSLDGGASYPIRLTPHLDASVRRTLVLVPRFPTPSARLLLRFGDERREVEVETPARFAITDGPALLAELARPAIGRGEAPRPGEEGVVAWVEGSRDGSGLRVLETAFADSSLERAWPVFAIGALAPAPLPGRAALLVPRHEVAPARGPEYAAETASAGDCFPPSVRLLIHRFNE